MAATPPELPGKMAVEEVADEHTALHKPGPVLSKRLYGRVPRHIGVIPDGNRRWAAARGLNKEQGYARGIAPGLRLCELCQKIGIEEVTFYGFTQDNTRRPAVQRQAFQDACVEAARTINDRNTPVLVVGNTGSQMFPPELLDMTRLAREDRRTPRVNLLVNYSWQWDLAKTFGAPEPGTEFLKGIGSAAISRIDLIIRWGGRRRLSGFLPIQSVHADFYVINDLWPDFQPQHFHDALAWYQDQDPTLGG